jgi:5-methylcytosine-specific restriction endonuclease McrA
MRPGLPTKCTPELIQAISSEIRSGITLKKAAYNHGMAPRTLTKYMVLGKIGDAPFATFYESVTRAQSDWSAIADPARKEKRRIYAREYNANYYSQHAAYWKAWRADNQECVKRALKRYRASEKGQLKAQREGKKCGPRVRAWRQANPVKLRLYSHKRRTLKLEASGLFTEAEWRAIVKRQSGRCAHCERKTTLTMDHIVPLSAGGCNFAYNIQGLCGPCNSAKGAHIPPGAQISLFDKRTPEGRFA